LASGFFGHGEPRRHVAEKSIGHRRSIQFDDQSDGIPMEIAFPGGSIHPVLRGPDGPLCRFPDHMHEGEVVRPIDPGATITLSNGEAFVEFPVLQGKQPVPTIIATADIIGGHTTVVDGSTCETNNFGTDPKPTVAGKIGTLCAYDGVPVGVGRILTDSSFHHYLDLNLVGDPCGVTVDRQQGFGKALCPPEKDSVLAEMQLFYGNAVAWLAKS
jgi:hypothetical protein